jgi:hypothetical protein
MLRRKKLPSHGGDATLHDADATRLRAVFEDGDWRVAEEVTRGVRGAAREWAIWTAADLPGRRDWLDVWVARAGDRSSGPWLARSAHRVHRAWRRLGPHPPGDPTDPAWVRFYRTMQDAEADAERAALADPSDAVPWSYLVAISRGLLAPLHRVCARMEETQVREPWLPLAHLELVRALGPSWGGAPELMWEAGRTASAEAPVGSPVHAVVPLAHLEAWRIIATAEDADAYLDDERVAVEISDAAERSVLRRAFGTTGADALARHIFLVAWCVLGDADRSRSQFDLLGDAPTPWPWEYLHVDPTVAFLTQRDRLAV